MNGESSEFKKVTSGIPQGSVLGPLLLVIFINDLPEQVNSECYPFRDDTKILREIKGSDDNITLQNDINTMFNWADKCQLQFCLDKCVSMFINMKTNHNEPHKMHTTELKLVKQEKDIGVIVDNQLKFESHILEKIKKANNILGLIMSVEKSMPPYSIEWKCWKRPFNTKWSKAIIPCCLVMVHTILHQM